MATVKALSPSRTYVAMCNKGDFSGFYFKKFTIPENYAPPVLPEEISASWYFLNVLDGVSCIEEIITWEDFQDMREVT